MAAAVATAELVVYNRERVFLSIVCVRSYLVLLGRSPAFLALKTELLDALVHRRTAALATPAGVPSIHLFVFQEVDNLNNRFYAMIFFVLVEGILAMKNFSIRCRI